MMNSNPISSITYENTHDLYDLVCHAGLLYKDNVFLRLEKDSTGGIAERTFASFRQRCAAFGRYLQRQPALSVTEDQVDGWQWIVSGTSEEGFVITNYPLRSISVEKKWVYEGDVEGAKPDSVTVRLYADGAEIDSADLKANAGDPALDWKCTFDGLDRCNEDGSEIVYTVTEDGSAGYETAVSGDADSGFIVTNTGSFVNITVHKVWNDANDRYHKRPESVTVKLLADGTEAGSAELKVDTEDADNSWSCTFEGLPRYRNPEDAQDGDEAGTAAKEEIVYTIDEASTEETEPGRINIPVEKFWDGVPAGPVTIYLYRKTGGAADSQREDTGRFLLLTEEKGWKDVFRDLPEKDAEGRKYEYMIEEEAVSGYTTRITGDAVIGFTVTNTFSEVPPPPGDTPPPPPPGDTTPPPSSPPPSIVPPTEVPVREGVLGASRGVLGAVRGVLGAARTGDDRYMYAWLAVMAGAAVLLAAWAVWTAKVRRRRERKEETR